MSRVFVGSDGSFISAWQAWKWRNHEPESFVAAYRDTLVFRRTDEAGNERIVWYHSVDEDDLPAGVEVDGVVVRDTREEQH